MIALISSVPEEGKTLAAQLRKKTAISGKPVYTGGIGESKVAYIVSGMGKTNAAHAATLLLERFSPRLIILFGIGGAYPFSGLRVGDIAIAEKEVYGDEGVQTKEGFQDTGLIGIPLLQKGRKIFFNEFPLDRRLVRKALKSFYPLPLAPQVKSGTFVTVSSCTGTRKRALELRKRYGAVCENMEGAAVAHLCALYGIPLLELRGISNMVDNRDRSDWNIRLAAENCQTAVAGFLRYRG